MNPRVRHQVGLELVQIHVERAVEAQRGRDGGDDLTDEPIQVAVSRPFDVQVALANVVNGLVVDHEGAIGMLQRRVGGENRVVRLHDGGGDLRRRIDGEFQLGFLTVIHGETFHEQGSEAGSGATTERVEDEEALESGTLVGGFANAIEHDVDDLFADCVMTASVVVGGVFLACRVGEGEVESLLKGRVTNESSEKEAQGMK